MTWLFRQNLLKQVNRDQPDLSGFVELAIRFNVWRTNMSGRNDDHSPQAKALYPSLKQQKGYVFPSKTKADTSITNTLFLHACRAHGVDRRITPGVLRANFILLAIQKNGVPWTKAVTGLSHTQISQYLDMIPPKARSPLD